MRWIILVLWCLSWCASNKTLARDLVKTETYSQKSMTHDAAEQVIVFIGDSLTQGFGVQAEQAYPELAGRELVKRGYHVRIINAGISGSVTADADRRVRWYLRARPKILVLALGANDGLKGVPPRVIETNLAKAIQLAKENHVLVLLAGLKMPRNLGDRYVRDYEAIFPRLAKRYRVRLIPFLLEDVALQKELNQSDMRHPNPRGHEIIAKRVAQALEGLLQDVPQDMPKQEASP